jgi:septal ring factor EnvC (AmiA/AmiB activator)
MSIDSDDQAKQLSKRKLELEIAELARPIWQRPAFITPVIAAALSVMLAYFSGWFDVQLTRLSNRRDSLERDIAKFQMDKSEIQTEVNALQEELKGAKNKINLANEEIKMAKVQLLISP